MNNVMIGNKWLFMLVGLLFAISLSGQVNPTFTIDTTSINSFEVKFTSTYSMADTLNYSFQWDFGDYTTSNLPIVSHMYDKAGRYEVSFTVSDNTNTDSSSEFVNVQDVFHVPNVFTPNGDGINDNWVVRTNGEAQFKVSIFSPSGSKVFEITAYTLSWDGKTPSGVEVNTGVYYYVITRQDKYIDTGFFHLIR